jgi:hypothetical protein
MFDGKSKIKVLIIGKDGQARKFWVDHDAEFYNNKYKIDFEAVYQSVEGGLLGFGSKQVPTIMFRENSVIAISHKIKATVPDPDEMGSSIARAAWALAELMKKKNEGMMQLMMALMLVACAIAGASAYISYNNGQKLDKLQASITTTVNNTQITPGGLPFITPTIPIPLQPTVPTPMPTPTPKPQGTPMPLISVT